MAWLRSSEFSHSVRRPVGIVNGWLLSFATAQLLTTVASLARATCAVASPISANSPLSLAGWTLGWRKQSADSAPSRPAKIPKALLRTFLRNRRKERMGGLRCLSETPWALTLQAANLKFSGPRPIPVSYTHLRAHETGRNLVCRLL